MFAIALNNTTTGLSSEHVVLQRLISISNMWGYSDVGVVHTPPGTSVRRSGAVRDGG
jgi:hypothetical protein